LGYESENKDEKSGYPATWKDFSEVYNRLKSQDSNRLTASSFLGGLTFAAFAALLSISNSLVTIIIALPTLAATICFLLVVLSSYESLRLLYRIPYDTAKKLQDGSSGGIDSDQPELKTAWKIHFESRGLLSAGALLLLLAIVLIALAISVVAFIFAIGLLVVFAIILRTVRSILIFWGCKTG